MTVTVSRLRGRADRVDQGRHDPHRRHAVRLGTRVGAVERVPGDVVGVPRLALEGEEDRDPSRRVREVEEQAPVLPHPVVAAEGRAVALVHVHVVDAVARREPEDLVAGALRSPALAEHVQEGPRVTHRPLHVVVEQVGEVVVGAGGVRGQRPHRRRVEEVAPDVVEVGAAGPGRQRRPAGGCSRQQVDDRMPEILDEEVQQLGRRLLGLHVDRRAVSGAALVRQLDLEVRTVVLVLAAPIDHPGGQDPVRTQRHDCSSPPTRCYHG